MVARWFSALSACSPKVEGSSPLGFGSFCPSDMTLLFALVMCRAVEVLVLGLLLFYL